MNGDLAQKLFEQGPRESSGGPSANRHGFHRTWAVCHLIELHASVSNYLLLLEFHDDVLVLEPADVPEFADFFQVKTKREGQWKRNDLVSRSKAKAQQAKPKVRSRRSADAETPKPDHSDSSGAVPTQSARSSSTLAKLLDHAGRFSSNVRTLNVVSNVTFDIELQTDPQSKDRERFCLLDLNPKELEEVKAALRDELELVEDPVLDRIFLHATGISLTQHETYGAGKLAEFLEKRYPDKRFRSTALFKNLLNEVARRAAMEWKPASFTELLQKKGVSRANFEDWIQDAIRDDPQEKLTQVRQRLESEKVDLKLWIVIERGWRRYVIGAMNHADTIFQEFVERVRAAVVATWDAQQFSDLQTFLTLGENDYITRFGEPELPLSRDLLKGAILFEFKSIETGQFQATSSQLTPQEK